MTNCFSDDRQTAFMKVPDPVQGNPSQVECTYLEMRGKRLTIESPVPVPCSAAVSIQYEDALYLGEVVSVTQENGIWNLEVKIEQILSGLTSLMALREQLLSERPVTPLAGVPAGSRN